MNAGVSLRAYTVNLAGDRWRYRVEARDGALKADTPTYEDAVRFFTRWADMTAPLGDGPIYLDPLEDEEE